MSDRWSLCRLLEAELKIVVARNGQSENGENRPLARQHNGLKEGTLTRSLTSCWPLAAQDIWVARKCSIMGAGDIGGNSGLCG
jgi:hypothetical protein